MIAGEVAPVTKTLMFCWQADDDGIAFMEVGGHLAAEVPTALPPPAAQKLLGRHAVIRVDAEGTTRIGEWLPLPDDFSKGGEIE